MTRPGLEALAGFLCLRADHFLPGKKKPIQ